VGHLSGAIAASASGGLAVAIATFLPPASDWDVTTAGAFAFLCGVIGRVVGLIANFVKGKVENQTTGEFDWPIDDALWGERLALVGGIVGTVIALFMS
jgi:hypothetical protein